MMNLVLQYPPTAGGACTLCGRPAATAGPQLVRADGAGPVCRDCGRKHAPALAALAQLAEAAERVAQIGRHSVFPPMSALLELARAADNYTHAGPGRRRAG
jgi:predicted CXXCH cytochrome family protein